MRKVLSIVLALAMILGSFAFSFAATPSDVVGEDCEDAVNVLTELGVIAGYPDGSYKPNGIVTRGEMAKIIICSLGLEDYAAGKSSFSDMAGNWSDKYVAYAVSLESSMAIPMAHSSQATQYPTTKQLKCSLQLSVIQKIAL